MALLINGRFLTRPVSGVERYGHGLVRAVAAEWPDARILVPGSTEGVKEVHGLQVDAVGHGTGHAWEQLQLPRHVGPGDVLLSPANTGPLRCSQHVVVMHDLAWLRHPEWFNRRFVFWYRMLVPRLFARAVGVIAVSGTMRSELLHYFGGDPSRVSVVPPFHDEQTFDTSHTAPLNRPFCLLVGSLDPRKGLAEVVSWYAALNAPDFDLVIIGRPHRAFAQVDLRMPEGVHFLRDVDDGRLAAFYQKALALIVNSTYEGFGLPLLEALSLGCPVIARRLPVFEEQFGDAVRYVDMDRGHALSEAISELRSSDHRGARIARGKVAAAAFTMDRTRQALRTALQPWISA